MSDQESHQIETQAKDVVPLKQKMAYSMGIVSDHFSCTRGLWIFFTPFFNDFLKVSAVALGWILFAGRIWDAVNDPLVGWLSDRSKSRFGRRRPFIFVGAIVTGIAFPILWFAPTEWGDAWTYTYIAAGVMLLYTSFSVFSVPYESLGAELTADYKERTNVFVVRTHVIYTLNMNIDWLMPLALFIGAYSFIGGDIGGVQVIGVLTGLVIVGAGMFPAFFCVERYKNIARREDTNPQAKLGFTKSIGLLITNKPLFLAVGVMAVYLFSIMSSATFAYYINTYMLYDGDRTLGATLGAYDAMLRIPFALLGAFVVKKLSDKYDKHQLMKASVTMLIIAFLSFFVTHRPDMPMLSLASKPLLAFAESWFWILVLSMRADVCDWDEYRSGHRREGVIAATTNWVNKAAMAVAAIFGGYALERLAGFDVKIPETAKDPVVMQKLMAWYVGLPVGALIIGLVFLILYPLSGKKMADIRAKLEARRGEASVDNRAEADLQDAQDTEPEAAIETTLAARIESIYQSMETVSVWSLTGLFIIPSLVFAAILPEVKDFVVWALGAYVLLSIIAGMVMGLKNAARRTELLADIDSGRAVIPSGDHESKVQAIRERTTAFRTPFLALAAAPVLAGLGYLVLTQLHNILSAI